MRRLIFWILGLATILILAFFFLNSYIYNEKQADEVVDGNFPDVILQEINKGKYIKTSLEKEVELLGVKITPLEILEDSRCPTDVECIWAGTVRLRATLEGGLGTADQTFELHKTITTEAEEVTLVNVSPSPKSDTEISNEEYIFEFKVSKRK